MTSQLQAFYPPAHLRWPLDGRRGYPPLDQPPVDIIGAPSRIAGRLNSTAWQTKPGGGCLSYPLPGVDSLADVIARGGLWLQGWLRPDAWAGSGVTGVDVGGAQQPGAPQRDQKLLMIQLGQGGDFRSLQALTRTDAGWIVAASGNAALKPDPKAWNHVVAGVGLGSAGWRLTLRVNNVLAKDVPVPGGFDPAQLRNHVVVFGGAETSWCTVEAMANGTWEEWSGTFGPAPDLAERTWLYNGGKGRPWTEREALGPA